VASNTSQTSSLAKSVAATVALKYQNTSGSRSSAVSWPQRKASAAVSDPGAAIISWAARRDKLAGALGAVRMLPPPATWTYQAKLRQSRASPRFGRHDLSKNALAGYS